MTKSGSAKVRGGGSRRRGGGAKLDGFSGPDIYVLQAEICAALASPVRLRILDLVSDREMTSAELLQILDIPKANLSQHLAVLKDAGIIQARRAGLFQYLSLSLPMIKEACGLVRGILEERILRDEKRSHELRRELRAQR
jgi:DNA-binding transcriptional ArsR family regulator